MQINVDVWSYSIQRCSNVTTDQLITHRDTANLCIHYEFRTNESACERVNVLARTRAHIDSTHTHARVQQ